MTIMGSRKTNQKQNSPTHQEITALTAMFAQGRYLAAENLARTLTKRYPRNGISWSNLGAVLNKRGRDADAVAALRKAEALTPNAHEVHYNLGVSLCALGQLDEAAISYRRALQVKPDLADAYNNLGFILLKQGLFEDAIAQFGSAIPLSPDSISAKIKLSLCQAIYQLSLVDFERAKTAAYSAREANPDDPIVLRGTSGIVGETRIATDEAIYTKELFNGFAETFDSTLESLGYSVPEHLTKELGLGSGDAGRTLDVLDAGCGTGLCGTYLRPVARTLVGVDLSSEMLRLAKEKNLYDVLHEAGINDFLKQNLSAFDLIVLADVLIYLGDLRDLIESSSRSLRQDGMIAVSVECIESEEPGNTYALQPSGRYQHSTEYVTGLLEDAGCSVEKSTSCILRTENSQAIPGFIVIAKKR